MGGQNHQPCRGYLEESVKMSRAASFAYAHLELANMELEDALTSEFEGREVSLDSFVQELRASFSGLEDLEIQITALRNVMEARDFKDLPTIKSLDWESIGSAMISLGLVTPSGWQEIWPTMQQKGFFGVLDHFSEMRSELTLKTKDLLSQIEKLKESSSIIDELEENREGNIKPAFAKLYTTWARFHQAFLASSMISTEAWYAFNKHGSLVGTATTAHVA